MNPDKRRVDWIETGILATLLAPPIFSRGPLVVYLLHPQPSKKVGCPFVFFLLKHKQAGYQLETMRRPRFTPGKKTKTKPVSQSGGNYGLHGKTSVGMCVST